MRSSTSPAALALLALPIAVSARPRCQSVYPVSSASVPAHSAGYNVSPHVVPSTSGTSASAAYPASSASVLSHSPGYNVSSHVIPSASGSSASAAYPASSASASGSLSSASHPASYSVASASASAPASHTASSASASISSAGYSASSASVSASGSYSASASVSYPASVSASYSASVSSSNSASASVSYSATASTSATASYSASASNSASSSAAYPVSSTPASSYPVADLGPAFCLINDAVISAMNKAPEATAFCSSYLSIPTQTTTVTATQTPADITVTVPATITGEDRITDMVTATATASADTTTTLTVTVPSTITVTSTTSTSVLTCLNSAYTASEPVGTIPADAPVVDKRTVSVATPTCLPTNWASAAVSRACSCLSVATPTITTTVTQTLAPGTATATTTDVLTPTVTATETDTVTETSTHTKTETVTDGAVTATAYAVATSIAASGLAYRRWEHPYDANLEAPGFTTDYFRGRTPLDAGALRSPTFRGNGDSVSLATTPATGPFAGGQAAVMMQGFFVARQTGTYTFWSGADDIDNWGYLWTGDAAYGDWRDDNTAFKAVRTGSRGLYTGGASSLTLRAGDAVPVAWLWANGGGAAASFLGIQSPDLSATTDGTDFFVLPCDNGVFQ